MSRRKLAEENIRKIIKSGESRAVTIPKEIMDELGWKEKQKVTVKKEGRKIVIRDWKA